MRTLAMATACILLAGCGATPIPAWTFAWEDEASVHALLEAHPDEQLIPPTRGTALAVPVSFPAAHATWVMIHLETEGWVGTVHSSLHLTGPSEDPDTARHVARQMLGPLLPAEAIDGILADGRPIILECTGSPCRSQHGGWHFPLHTDVTLPATWLVEGRFLPREPSLVFGTLHFVGEATWHSAAGPKVDMLLPRGEMAFATAQEGMRPWIEFDALGAVAFTVPGEGRDEEAARQVMIDALTGLPVVADAPGFRTSLH